MIVYSLLVGYRCNTRSASAPHAVLEWCAEITSVTGKSPSMTSPYPFRFSSLAQPAEAFDCLQCRSQRFARFSRPSECGGSIERWYAAAEILVSAVGVSGGLYLVCLLSGATVGLVYLDS